MPGARIRASWSSTRSWACGSRCCSCPLTPLTAIWAFLLFRGLDIVKPYPARQLERLPGGWGIMADDLMAGVYANLLLRVGLSVWPVA